MNLHSIYMLLFLNHSLILCFSVSISATVGRNTQYERSRESNLGEKAGQATQDQKMKSQVTYIKQLIIM
jgi:hypothetical protein